ncbi:Hypothetical protein LUCI_4710 [Lucifera butyrica]|uniref:Uncharacterized protein n=1 Tax=Lucifera butyrica TaxID=1351585 RepID=A0A498RF34_9FIRM|nr:hypothetical protein [Lucifera butyrica]VBB09420.1 Hypothetical protein LUCI_4710 [Lucifera butyrica]
MSERLPLPEKIAALLPTYTAGGDSTSLITTEGATALVSCRIRSLLLRLARSQAKDLTALKRQVACNTRQNILQPLPLSAGLVLFPVKTRRPRVPGDPTTGYINLYAVAGLHKHTGSVCHTVITLSSGMEIPTLWSPATVNRHLLCARLAVAGPPRPAGSRGELGVTLNKLTEVIYEILAWKQNQHE